MRDLIPRFQLGVLNAHFMILAEERICTEKCCAPYVEYTRRVPRYFTLGRRS